MWYIVEWVSHTCSQHFASKQDAIDYAEHINELQGYRATYTVYECANLR